MRHDDLDLPPGTLVTADAMHCQQESARYITQELGGDYLFGLKGNQSGILEKADRIRMVIPDFSWDDIGAWSALDRLGHPDETAELAAFLVSDRNSYMTGEVIVQDGGVVV